MFRRLENQVPGRCGVWWEPVSQFIDDRLLSGSLYGGRGKGALWGLFYLGTQPIRGLHPHNLITFRTLHLPIYHAVGEKFSTYEFGGVTKFHSIAVLKAGLASWYHLEGEYDAFEVKDRQEMK